MSAYFRGVLHFRLLILGVAIGLLGLGIISVRGAPVDVLPEFTPPYAEIQTEALGLSADEVEQLITVPLEADLLNGVEGVDVIRSESLPGLSSIVLVFQPGTDTYRARQLVEERLTQAHALPNVSKPPTLLAPLSSSNRVLMIGLDSDKVSPIEQSVIARWTVRPRLMGVPGVANVSVWGQRDQQLQVQVDPEHLRDEGRHPQRSHPLCRQRPGGLTAELPRGLDAGDRRLHRDPATAAASEAPAREDRRPGRAREGPGVRHGRQPAPGGRRDPHDRPPAPHRRRGHRRWSGTHARRRRSSRVPARSR